MALHLELRGRAYLLVAREHAHALAGHHTRLELPRPGLVSLLSEAVDAPGGGLQAASLFAATKPPRSAAEREDLTRRLVALLDSGRIMLYLDTRARAVTLDNVDEQAEIVRDTFVEQTDWIEIVVENEAGEPVVNTRYVLTLADGSVRRGQTNAQGVVRYDRIASGSCTLQLPDLDAELWTLD